MAEISFDVDCEELVTRTVDEGDTLVVAIVDAFRAIGFDVGRADTTLSEWIDPDALHDVLERSGPQSIVYVRIWNYPVTVTAREVVVYGDAGP